MRMSLHVCLNSITFHVKQTQLDDSASTDVSTTENVYHSQKLL